MQPTTVICSWLPCHVWYTFFDPLGASTTFTQPVLPSSGNPLLSIFIVHLRSFSAASPPHHFPKYSLAFLNHTSIPALVTEARCGYSLWHMFCYSLMPLQESMQPVSSRLIICERIFLAIFLHDCLHFNLQLFCCQRISNFSNQNDVLLQGIFFCCC